MSNLPDRLHELLSYESETGIFRWRVPRQSVQVGAIAGSDYPDGYRRIMIDQKLYLAHRLAWLYVHRQWPMDQLDHVNRNRSDNRLANLREANRSQNQGNRGKDRDNKSGFKGVTWERNRWKALIGANGQKRTLGYFSTPEDAHEAYMRAAKEVYGKFARSK